MPGVCELQQGSNDVVIDPSRPMTATHVFHPLLACLDEVQRDVYDTAEKLNAGEGAITWEVLSEAHKPLILALSMHHRDLPALKDVMESTAARLAQPVNEWLQTRGFQIQLEQPDPPRTDDEDHDLFVASVLDLLVDWQAPGERREIKSRRTQEIYPGVVLHKGQLLRSAEHPHWIVAVPATLPKGGEPVFFFFTLAPEGQFALAKQCQNLLASAQPPEDHVLDYLHFPMVDLDQTIYHDWCVGLAARLGLVRSTIQAAVQQTRFKMNERGAHLKSAAAMHSRGMITCSDLGPERVRVILDQPYLVWVTRRGVNLPLLAAYLAEDTWSDPQGLGM